MCSDKFDIIVVAGQSNAEGYGAGEDKLEYVPDDNILIERGDFSSLVKQTEYGNEYLDLKVLDDYYIEKATLKDGRGCFALSFAKKYKENNLENGRKVLIVQSSIGGTGFSKNHWGVTDILYARMVKMVEYALGLNRENRIVAFLWHQGEHDVFENAQFNYEERHNFYYNKLSQMINDFRSKFGIVPFICAGFTRQWYEDYPEKCKAVYKAIEKIANEKEKFAFVSKTEDLLSNAEKVRNNDKVHFCKESLSILGLRYYEKWLDL